MARTRRHRRDRPRLPRASVCAFVLVRVLKDTLRAR
jgi:hypothetical protein